MPGRAAAWSAVGAIAAAAAVPVAALTVPAYEGVESSSGGVIATTHATIVDENGVGALVPATLPLVAAFAVALLLHRRCTSGSTAAIGAAWAIVGVMAALALVAIASIGLWMVPAVVLLALSTVTTPRGTAPGT